MNRFRAAFAKKLDEAIEAARTDIPAGEIRDQLRGGAQGVLPPSGNTGQGYTPDPDAVTRVQVRKNSTGSTFERRRLNLIEGSGVTLTVADDSGSEEVDITIAASGGGTLTVEEADGSPTDSAVTKIVFPNGTLGIASHVATYTPSSGAPTTAPYVTTASDAGLSAEIVIPGLAASADIKGAAGAGTAEEFDGGGSPFTWSSSPGSEDVNTTVLSHLYLSQSDVVERRGYKSWSPAGAFDARMKVALSSDKTSGDTGAVGLIIADSGDTSRALCSFAQLGTGGCRIQGYTYASGAYTQRGSSWDRSFDEVYLRIKRDGSNNVSFYWSANGKLWQLITTQSFTFTVAKLGVYMSGNAATAWYAAIDWLRTDV